MGKDRTRKGRVIKAMQSFRKVMRARTKVWQWKWKSRFYKNFKSLPSGCKFDMWNKDKERG